MGENAEFERIVADYYRDLFRFAFSLTHNETDATDLTQQAYYRYATKGHMLRDPSKVKSWLFRIVKNEFLDSRRHSKRFPHHELEESQAELPMIEPSFADTVDSHSVLEALQKVDETYRLPLGLFYMEGLAYREIAEALEIPIGTVMSRLSRGKAQLKALMHGGALA